MKSVKRFFKKKRRSQSENTQLPSRSKEEQASLPDVGPKTTAHSAPPATVSSSAPKDVQKNGTTKTDNMKTESTEKADLPTSVQQKGIHTTRTKHPSASGTSNVLIQTIKSDSNKEAISRFADTDSDDAGMLKGVSTSFRGLNATEPFEETLPVDPDGRIAKVSEAYDAIPLIEQNKLPRGGISMETKAVGRIQVRKLKTTPTVSITVDGKLTSSNLLSFFLPFSLVWYPSRNDQG